MRNVNIASSKKEEAVEKNSAEKPKFIIRMMETLMSISIFMLFFGMPLFFTGLTFQGIAFEKQMYFYFWLLIAVVVWAVKGVISGELKIRKTPLDIPIIFFWATYALATFFSVDRWHSFMGFPGDPSRGLLSITALIISYYLIFSHFNRDRIKLIATASILSGAVVSAWTFLAVMGIKFLPDSIIAFAPISLVGSVSSLGVFLGMMLPVMVAVVLNKQTADGNKKLVKNIATAAILLLMALDMFLLFALYAFAPWIAILIGIGFFLIFVLSLIVKTVEKWTWLPMLIFVMVLAVLMIGNSFKLTKINLPVEVSPSYKLSWDIAKEAVKNDPVLGSGAATYGYDFSLYKTQNFNLNALYNLRFYQGTGVFLEAFPSIGILGGIALALVFLTFLSVGVYLLSFKKDKNKIYSLGFMSAAIVMFVVGILNRVDSATLIIGVLIGAAALATAMVESDSEERILQLSLKASPKFALTLAFIFMIVSVGVVFLFVLLGKMYAADLYAGSALRQSQVSEGGSVSRLVKAINLNNKESRYYMRVGQEYMVLANNEMLKNESERNVDAIRGYLNNSIAAARQGRDLMKKDVLANETLGQIYENAGIYVPDSLSLSKDAYQQALDLEPRNPNLIAKLGQLKISEASTKKDESERRQLVEEAKNIFQKSIDEKSNFSLGYYQLALAKDALGDVDGAINDMTQALSLENNNINFVFNLARLYQERGKNDDNKIAESLYKKILGANDREANTHFSLGTLYEKTNRKDEAISEYQKVLDLLPEGSDQTKAQVEKMISNIRNGIENTPENLRTEAPAAAQDQAEAANETAAPAGTETPTPSEGSENQE